MVCMASTIPDTWSNLIPLKYFKIINQSLWHVWNEQITHKATKKKNIQKSNRQSKKKKEINRQSNTSQKLHISYPKILQIFVKMYTFLQNYKVLQMLEIEPNVFMNIPTLNFLTYILASELPQIIYIVEITRKRKRFRVLVPSVFKCKPRSLFAKRPSITDPACMKGL